MEEQSVSTMYEEKEINVLDILITLLKWKRLIIGLALAFAAITSIIVLVVSPLYRAKSTIMPPNSSGSAAAQLAGQLGAAAGITLAPSPSGVSADLYAGLLADQSCLDPIIERFELLKLYGVDKKEDARRILLDGGVMKTEVDAKTGILAVSIEDVDPKRSAEMTNALVEELRNLIETVTVTDETKRRIFFEKELKKAHDMLAEAEEALKGFQENSGVLKIEDQASAILGSIVAIKTQITSEEVKLQVMRTYSTASNPDYIKAMEQLKALKAQLNKLEEKQEASSPNVMIPIDAIPNLGIEYIRKMRDYNYKQTLYELLVKQYETARIDEAKESAILQVIHQATVPEKRTRPNRILIVGISTLLLFFIVTGSVIFAEQLANGAKRPENMARLRRLKAYLKSV